MKKLTEIEVKQKILAYLNKKGISILLTDSESLIWNYKIHYSEFTVRLVFERKKWEDRENNIIKYSVSASIKGKGIGRRRTSFDTAGYCLAIYNNLIYIKGELDKIAENIKEQRDAKTRYCTELESYYKKIHKSASISVSKSYDGGMRISVSGYDTNKSTYYQISYLDNRYYLESKSETLTMEIEL